MDLSGGLMPHLCLGHAAFLSDDEIASLAEETPRTPEALQVDSLEILNGYYSKAAASGETNHKWRIDGCDGQGTQFFALPVFLSSSLKPLRIDVFIPDQTQHPPLYRRALGSSSSFCIRDKRVAGLGISRLIVVALDHWAKTYPDFQHAYLNSPFGSRIVFENIDPDPQNIRIKLIPDFSIERQFLTIDALQGMWNLPDTMWPSRISLESLELVRQLHDTISVVRIPNRHVATEFIFKTTTGGTKYLYHELKLLLTIPPHPHIMPKPLYIVTRTDRYTNNKEKVYGFILNYYQKGNLASLLATRIQEKSLELSDQYKWARQIASTLSFIQASPAKFYSELKVDNLLVTDDNESIVFIDFEQMGNWMTYSAPEIHYVEYLSRLVKAEFTPRPNKEKYQRILDKSFVKPLREEEEEETYTNTQYSYYNAWNMLTKKEQEAAMVYSLGMTLWCLFEGCRDTRNSILKQFDYDHGLEYPCFQRTPPDIQNLILRCTKGSPYLLKRRHEVFREESRIFPRGHPSATAVETIEAARGMWRQRISEAVIFLEARDRWRSGIQKEGDEEILGFMLRPSLIEVLSMITKSETRNLSQS